MKKFTIIGIGEILWDMLPQGKLLGGAPANFIYHCSAQGADAYVISAIGDDDLGDEISTLLVKKDVQSYLTKGVQPTGYVSVELSDDGEPSYNIHEEVAWDDIQLTAESIEKLKQVDAICFGSLAQRGSTSKKSIQEALSLVPDHALKIFDINIRQHYFSKELIESSLEEATILKLNEEEMVLLQKMFELEGDIEQQLKTLIETYDLQLIALTNGGKGSFLYTKEANSYIPTPQVEVADTIGAGDAFTATMCIGLLEKKSLREIHQEAIKVSAFVCTQHGAMPEYTL